MKRLPLAASLLSLFVVVLLCLTILLAQPTLALAQRKTLRASYPAPVTLYLPLLISRETWLFSKHGLHVELVHVGSSPIAMAAYLAGEIDILGGGGSGGPHAATESERAL